MALIGLYDADLERHGPRFFNLELMKIATYYKMRRDVVGLTDRLSPSQYSKFFYRQDVFSEGFPRALYQNENIIYGGYAFTGENYKPLPSKIELMVPDTTIYHRLRRKYDHAKLSEQIFIHNLNSHHIRLCLDGNEISPNFYEQLDIENKSKAVILHDKNIGTLTSLPRIVKVLAERLDREIVIETKFPVLIDSNNKNWLEFLDLPWGSYNLNLYYMGLMEDTVFAEMIEKQKTFLTEKEFKYIVTHGLKSEEEFYVNVLPKLLMQCIYSKNKKIPINFSAPEGFFKDPRAQDLLKIFTAFSSSGKKMVQTEGWYNDFAQFNDTFYKFIKTITKNGKPDFLSLDRIRNAFDLVREKNYKVFDGLYQQNSVVLKGGEFVDERQTRDYRSY